MVEEWKWRGVPVWEHDGIICTGETYKAVVKMTFARGAALKDPAKLFNSSLEGNVRRAIDIVEGDKINEKALKDLVRAAVELNQARRSRRKARSSEAAAFLGHHINRHSSWPGLSRLRGRSRFGQAKVRPSTSLLPQKRRRGCPAQGRA